MLDNVPGVVVEQACQCGALHPTQVVLETSVSIKSLSDMESEVFSTSPRPCLQVRNNPERTGQFIGPSVGSSSEHDVVMSTNAE